MKDTWPTELRLTPDAFNLHVVPMVNVRKDMADPIECDGKAERYPLHHPDVGARFVIQRLLAVYKMSDKDGLVPLEPGVVGTQRESYEVVFDGRDEERRASLALHLPSAFEKPERVAVEALWYQPSLQGGRRASSASSSRTASSTGSTGPAGGRSPRRGRPS